MEYKGIKITSFFMNEMPTEVTNEMLYKAFMDFKFNVENRLDRIENRLDQLEKRMEQLEKRMDQLESRVERIEYRLDRVEDQLRDLHKNQEKIQIQFSRRVLFGTGFLSAVVAFIVSMFTGVYTIEK